MSDPYLIPGTDVLRNKFGILNADDLDHLVDDIATIEAAYLFNEGAPIKPTLAGWQAVHRAMFGAVFDWAGEFRTVHIRKLDENGKPSGYFAGPDRIEADGRKAVVTWRRRCGALRTTTSCRSRSILLTSTGS